MSTVSSFLFTVGYVLGAVWELARYSFRFALALLPRAVLAARLLATESQLAVAVNHAGVDGILRPLTLPHRLLTIAP